MKYARFLLIIMVLLVSPLFSIQTPTLNVGEIEETKSLFFGEEVTIQNKRYSENLAIIDVVGLKPEEIYLGKVSRTYNKSIAIGKWLVNSNKIIKARGHPIHNYKNKIG